MGRRALVLLAVVGVTAVVGAALYRGALTHGFSAREEPWAIEAFVARRLRRLATGTELKKLRNPLPPTPLRLAEARDHFADHCAVCHGNDGGGRTPINDGLYPPAPDLRERGTQQLTDGELLGIIRNGIRFTGMPGWGGDDEENWTLVLFIRHLPDLSPEEIELIREAQGRRKPIREGGHGHGH
jgi:mono/diheme cytochrome c family protein